MRGRGTMWPGRARAAGTPKFRRPRPPAGRSDAMMGFNAEFWVVVGLIVIGTVLSLSVLARLYRKVGPNQALIVYGLGGTRVYSGRGAVVWPMIQSARDLSLELMSFDVAPQQDLYTKQGVAVTVEAVAQIKVKSDHESVLTAAEQFLTKTPEEREALIR